MESVGSAGNSKITVDAGKDKGDDSGTELSGLGGLGALLGGLAGMTGSGGDVNLEGLSELEALLGGLTGEGSEDAGEWSGLLEGVEEANREAEVLNNGWPKTLRAYPDGTAKAVTSYRTEISGSSKETMLKWIDDLKKDGFQYQDFYDFGMSESDMLSSNGWWGYDGKTYLSISYYDGVVTIDHTKELPDLGSYF